MDVSTKTPKKRTKKSSQHIVSKEEFPQKNNDISTNKINEDNIDQFLLSKGFAPVARVHLDNKKTSYLKAFTKLGHMCYIQLDVDKPVIREQDLSLIKHDKITKEPIKDGRLHLDECAKLEVCGIAYECNDGICVLKRDLESLDLKEDIFTVTELPSVQYGIEKNAPLSYPIVLYSEIIANEDAVLWNIARVTIRLKSKSIQNYNKDLMHLRSVVTDLYDTAITLIDNMHKARDNVINSTSNLHNVRDKYTMPIEEVHRESYDSIIYKLHTCEDLMGELILTSRNLSETKIDMLHMTELLSNYNEDIKSRYF